MNSVKDLSNQELTRLLAYAGLILVAFELVKSLIVKPVKAFYANVTFRKGMPFKSYEDDVLSRHKNEFEANLLYLRDFMEAINSEDVMAIQALRKHRNELAHNLANKLPSLDICNFESLLTKTDRALFKLSNYRTYIEIGSDPEFQHLGIDWDTVKGHEYLLFKEVVKKAKLLDIESYDA